MASKLRVGLLTSQGHPLLPYLLDAITEDGVIEPELIFDEKDFSARDQLIFTQRTEGAFPRRDIKQYLDVFPSVSVPNHNGPQSIAHVTHRKLDLLLNAGTPRLLSEALLRSASIGVVNVHPGLLPKYRGASCCEWALYNDDPVGVTAHFMDEGLDSGPIILRNQLSIGRGQSYTDVRVALYRLCHEVSRLALRAVCDKGLTPNALPSQAEGTVFKPMPDRLLEIVKSKLQHGEYRYFQH